MSILPDPVDTLDEAGQALYQKMCEKRGRIDGMYRTLLHNPDLTRKVSDLGGYLRFEGKLPGDVREAVILFVARELDARYEWVKHEPCARAEQVPDAVIVALRDQLYPMPAVGKKYLDAIQAARCVLERKSIPENLQARLVQTFDSAGVVELVTMVGFYEMIAGVLFAFDVPLPDGETCPF